MFIKHMQCSDVRRCRFVCSVVEVPIQEGLGKFELLGYIKVVFEAILDQAAFTLKLDLYGTIMQQFYIVYLPKVHEWMQ